MSSKATLSAEKQGAKPLVLTTIEAVRDYRAALTAQGKTLAFVPTMGALHEGHLSLMQLGAAKADAVICSIFVNPTQFGPNEDYSRYPRTWDSDLQKLADGHVHAVFAPDETVMYPEKNATTIQVSGLTSGLCGPIRPGHFDGVALVVTKLLNIVQPEIAIFGEKDFQQLQVIRQFVRDLNMNIEIVGAPTMRDAHGLAMSSRNAYLTADEYEIATSLNRILYKVADNFRKGVNASQLIDAAKAELIGIGFNAIDYVAICNADTLQPMEQYTGDKARVLAAVHLGKTRLIDNIAVL